MVWHLGHLRFGVKDDEDRVEKLSPQDIPKFLRKVASVTNQCVKKISQCSGFRISEVPGAKSEFGTYLDRTSRSSPVINTSWKAIKIGYQNCSS